MFELRDKTTKDIVKIYSVRSKCRKTEFLIYTEEFGFVWNDSSYFIPQREHGVIKEMEKRINDARNAEEVDVAFALENLLDWIRENEVQSDFELLQKWRDDFKFIKNCLCESPQHLKMVEKLESDMLTKIKRQ